MEKFLKILSLMFVAVLSATIVVSCNGSSGSGDSGSSSTAGSSNGGTAGQDFVNLSGKLSVTSANLSILAPLSTQVEASYGLLTTTKRFDEETTHVSMLETRKMDTKKFLSYGDRKLDVVVKIYSLTSKTLSESYTYLERDKLIQTIVSKVAYKDLNGTKIDLGKFDLNSPLIDRKANPQVEFTFDVEDPLLNFFKSNKMPLKNIVLRDKVRDGNNSELLPLRIRLKINEIIEKSSNGTLADFLKTYLDWNYAEMSFEPERSYFLGYRKFTLDATNNVREETTYGNFGTPRFILFNNSKNGSGSTLYPPAIMYSSEFTEADYPEDKAMEYFFTHFKFE